MDTNKNPFAFLNSTSGSIEPNKTTGGSEFDFLQAREKPLSLGSVNAADIGALAKEEGAAHLMPVINAIYGQESGAGANSKTSTDGARGGMQIMPDTFRRFAKQGESIDNPADNMRVGLRIIKSLGDKFGNDPGKIAAGYFSGEGNVNAGSGAAWKNDHKDGNGKSVSGYVSDVLGRLSPIKEAKAAENLPDLSQIPKWSEISTSERFLSLPDEDKTKLKASYFDDVLAPHAGSDAAKVREQFMAQRDSAPSFSEKTDAKLAGIVPAVKSLFGTGSVMDGFDPNAPKQTTANLNEAMQGSQTLRDVDTSVANRQARLERSGINSGLAGRLAKEAAAAGTMPGEETKGMGVLSATPAKNGAADVATGLTSGIKEDFAQAAGAGIRGVGNFLSEEAIGNKDLSALGQQIEKFGADIYKHSKKREGRNQPTFESETGQGLYSGARSLSQMLTYFAATGGNPTATLGLMVGQTGAQGVGEALEKGENYFSAGAYGTGQAALEYATEKLPMGYLAKHLGKEGFKQFVGGFLLRELPSEQVATLTQDALQKAILEPEKTWAEYAKERPSAAYQTLLATGVMAGGMGALNKGVELNDAYQADLVKQRALDNWNKGLLGVPRSDVPAVQTPDGRIEPNTPPKTSTGPITAAEPTPLDVHPTSAVADSIVADLATKEGIPHEFVLPQQTTAPANQSDEFSDQDLMDLAEVRYRQIIAKRDGSIKQVPTDGGMVDQEAPGQPLTPQEQDELATLESQNPVAIRDLYGMSQMGKPQGQPIPADASANQSFGQEVAPAASTVEQPAQGEVFPTATEPGLVAAQENQNAQSTTQAPPAGAAPSQATIEPAGQPIRPAEEPQPANNGAATEANPGDPVGVAAEQVQPESPVIDLSGRNEQQLNYLASNGQPGWKEAAQAELSKRGVAQQVAPQGQFNSAEEAHAYIHAQRRRAGGKLPKALPLPYQDGSFGLATEGQAGWEEAAAFAKANAPKTEKEAKARKAKADVSKNAQKIDTSAESVQKTADSEQVDKPKTEKESKEKRAKKTQPQEQTNGTEAAETKQAEEEKPQAPDTGTGETISQNPKTENISKGAKASRDVAAKADQPVVDGVEAIAAQIQQSIAEHNIKANEKIAREQVAKGHITQEQADADLDRTRKMWEGVKPNERTLALAKAVAAKDPRPLVGAWAKEGQGTYGIEGSVAAFENITGVKLLRLGSAARAKAIFDWAGWSEDQVVADIAERRKSNVEQKAAYEAKRQKEDDERIEKRAASEMVEFRDTSDKKGIKDYIDGLIEQGFNRIITSKVGAITKTYLANEKGTGYPLPVGLLRDYADVAVRKLVASKTDATADKPKTEKEAKAKRDEMVAFKHAGLNIYPVKVGGSLKWAVQTVDNAAREKAGERQIGGDAILDSKESAIAEAERFIKQAAADEARLAEIDAAQQQEVAAKAEASEAKAALLGDFYANKERIVRDRAAATLAKMIKSDGKVMTRADLVKSLIADGSKLSIDMVNKIKPMSRTQFNRASSAEQRAHEDKIKQGGKVSEYMIGNFVVSKTEYDYAEHLLAKSQQPEKKAEKSPKPAKTEKSVKADKARQQLEAHFTPGNIVYNDYWKTHNRVLGFDWNNGNWSATEEEVKQQDGKWVAAGDKRTHSTSPGAKDKVVEQAAKETSAPAEAIADFGEKIGGARKDVWSGFKDGLNAVKDADIATEPLSKVWPAPDYQKLIDSGIPAESVSAIRALRDEIPQKPRSSWKVKRWADQVKVLRDLSNDILNGSTVADLKKIAGANTVLDKFFGRVDLYQAVGHEKSLQGINLSFHHYTLYKGQENVSLWSVEQDVRASAWSNWPREIATGKTKEEAIEAFKKQYAGLNTEKAAKTVSFDIYTKSSGKGYWIGKKAGRNILPLEGPFETLKEARSYKTENTDKLVEKLAKVKEIPNERRDSNDPRVGADMRNGQDVTPQMFGDTFGFRGVEFGNWVEQGKRQQDLNDSYDALMDMAAILGLPPKALSLNGELGLAFGARGTGGTNAAKAHYELDFVAINMTKKSGAGSLGHEWWHAVDNYFSRMRDKPVAMMTEALDVSLASRGSNFELANDKVRREMIDAFGAVVSAIKQTAIKARSSKLDAKRSKQYWTTTPEMSARAFESYLISKLQDQNAANDYLANIVDPETWKAAEALGFELDDSYPYPTAGEIPAIRAGFDKFFETVETKSNEHGGVTMFSRSGAEDTWYQSPLKNAFEQAPDRIFGKAPQLKLWLASNAAKLGIKKDEIEWSGINEFLDLRQGSNVPKQDLLEFLSNNGVKVQDVMKHNAGKDLYVEESRDEEGTWLVFDADDNVIEAFDSRKSAEGFLTSATKYGSFTLPGGTNYKELLLTLPDHGAESVHDQRQRLKEKYGVESWFDLTDAQKEDLRKSDEKANLPRVQYKSGHWDEPNILAHVRFNDRTDADGNKVLFIEELQSDWAQAGRKLGFGYKDQTPLTPEEDRELMNLYGMRAYARTEEQTARMHELNNRLNAAQGKSGIPDAPFVKDTKAWVSLAIKRMVAYAAENGYDKVAFVNGKQSADRYSLSKQIDTLHYNPTRQTLVGTKDGLGVVHEIHVSSDKLDSYVGKEVADRLLSQEPNEHGLISLKGQELEVGGEGMKSFYDKIVPQVANDVLKKLGGGKVGLVEVAKNGRSGKAVVAADRGRMKSEGSLYDQLGFTITPEMREMVAKGLPLFSRGKPSQGMALRDLKAIVDRARSSLKNLPQVHVLHTPDGLDMDNPSQERLRKEIYRRGAEYDVEGVSHDGEIYLFSANIADEFRAEHVLVNHEVGHYGLREVFGRSGLDPIMNTIYMTNAKVRKQADALRKKFGLESNAEATEEVLVEMAPNELIKLNAWRRLVRHVRDWLESHGFAKMAERLNALMKAGMTEQQKADMLVADVVNAARNWVRNGTPSQSSTVQETKLSQADQNDSDLLERDRANIETAARRMGQFVDEFLDGKVKDSDTYILGDTPAVLRALGAEDRKMQIDGYTIHKILDGKHRYFITPDMLKQIPDHLYDPLAVFDSPKDGKPGKIVLTELSDAITGKPVIVAVHLSKKSGRITVNEISSVYETSDGTQRSKLTPEALEYYRNEKSLEQTTTPNLSTPLAGVVQSAQDLGKNILTESDIVKQYGPKFSRKPIGEVVRDLQSNVVQFYGNQDLKTFNGLNRTINTQFHKALKDKDFGRVYNLIQGMQNHVATASARPAELAPGILHRVDNVIQAVKTLVSKSQRQAIEKAGDALFAGTLNGHSVMDGRVWTEAELREKFKLDDTGVALYRQARKAIDASLTELAAAEAYALAENYLPKALRADIIESPEDAGALIVAALGRQIDMARKANLDEDAQAGIADAKEKVQAIFDQADKLKKAGYAPLMRFGKFDLKMMAIDPATGNLERDENDSPVTLYYSRFESQAKLREAERELRDRYADKLDEIRILPGVVNDNANELYRGVNPETLSVFAEAVGARQAMDDYIRLVRSERSAMKRRLERKGTPGYSLDVQRVLANFITSNARQAAQQLFGTSVNNAIRRIPREKGDVQKEALALRDYVINPKDNGALGSSLMFAWFLGGSPAAALVNMTQPVMMTLPHLSQYGTARAAAELTKAVPYAMGAKQITNADLRAALKKASLQGIVDAQEVFHLYAIGSRQMSHWVTKIGLHEATGQAAMTLWGSMFSAVEGMNRRLTFIAAWNVAKARGEANPYEFAVDAVNQTQGIYNKANRPNGARSAVGRAVFTFKTYSIMYTELMHRMWKSGPEGKKAVLLMMAVLILASGIDGLPGAGLLDAIIDRIGQFMGYDTNMRRWKRRHAYELLGKVAGDLVLYGASSMLPLDFGGRLGMGNMIPGSELIRGNYAKGVAEFIGPTAGAARQVGDAIDAAEEGNRVQAAVNLMPKAGRDLFNAIDMGRRGYARDAAGRKTVETTMTDAVVKGFGFNPTVVADRTRASIPIQQDVQLAKKKEASIVHAWAQAIVDGDQGAAKEEGERLKTWNKDNPDTPIRITADQIRSRVALLKTDKNNRITKTAPKEMRGRIGLELLKN